MAAGDPADQSEKRDWDVPAKDMDHHVPEQLEREEAAEVVESDAPHPAVHGETPDEAERRDWEVP